MFKIALISILLPFLSISQKGVGAAELIKHSKVSKLSISGLLQATHFSQGGMDRSDDYLIPFPLNHFTLCVVRIDPSKGNLKFVTEITTDSEGKFNVKLEPGKYGFVRREDLNNLTPSQCLPPYESSGTIMQSSTSSWESNLACPLVVSDNEINGLVITNHQRSICGLCP